MFRVGALAVMLAACDVVFGFQDVRPPPDAPDAAVDPLMVTGSYKQIYVTNDASFAPMVSQRIYAPGTISFAVTLDDGAQPEVTYNSDGTFSFPRARDGQAYRFVATVDGGRVEVQQSSPVLDFNNVLAGRPDRVPLNATTVQFPYSTSTGLNQPAWLLSTGVYTQSYTGMFGPTVTFDWRLASPASGAALGLLEAGKYDQLMPTEMEADVSIPGFTYTTIKGISKASVSQVPGGVVTIAGPQPIARNTCARFASPNITEYNRIAAADPRQYTGNSGDWFVFMAPAPNQLGATGALWVASSGFNPLKDVDVAPTFHDPFVGRTLLVETAAAALFTVTLGGNAPGQFANVSRRYALAERGNPSACTPAKTMLPSTTALATSMTLDGTPLDMDTKVIALDLSKLIPFTWSLTPGRADYFSLSIQEIVGINGGTTTVVRGGTVVGGQPSALLDPAMFLPGHKYIIAVTTQIGRPNVPNGDWVTYQLPTETTTMWSRYFEAQAR